MELFKLFGTIAVKNSDANTAIDETTGKAQSSENTMVSSFKKIGAAVATYFAADKIIGFGKSCIDAAADAQASNSQFSQVFGDLEGDAKKALGGIASEAGITETRMKGSYTKIAAFAKTTGMDTQDAMDLSNRALVAVADSAAFYDRSLEDTTESLQSFLKGNYENDAALGLSCTETTRNQAANKLYGKSFKDLSEAQKQLTLLQMVEDANAASGALGQAARESDTWTNQTGNLKQAWEDFKAVIGENFLDVAVQGVKKVSGAVQKLSENLPAIIQTFKDWLPLIAGIGGAFATLKIAMGISGIISAVTTAWTAYKTANEGATIAQWLFNAALNANPIVLIVSLIAGLVVAIITLWNTNEGFRIKVIEIWNGIKETFSTVIEAIKGFFTGLWEKIKEVWEGIKTTISEKIEAIKTTISNVFTAIQDIVSTVWETIKNVIQVAIMFIVEILTAAFELITLPFRFIWENCRGVIIAAWETIKTTVSNALEAIKTVISTVWNAIVAFLSPILEGIKTTFTNIWNGIKSVVTTVVNAISSTISTVWNAIKTTITTIINAIKTVISTVWNAIKGVITTVMNGIKTTFSNVWNSIKTTISNVINGVKSVISNGLNAAKSTVSNILEGIKSKFSSIFEGAKNIVSGAIERIKGFFNFSWSLPKLKMPHPTISGSFSLNPPSVPHFSIEWYKKAMNEPRILTEPTVFGVNPAGQPMGGGEAGDEVISGKNTLLNMIRESVAAENSEFADKLERLISICAEYFPAILAAMSRAVVLDSGALVGELAPALDDELGIILKRRERE